MKIQNLMSCRSIACRTGIFYFILFLLIQVANAQPIRMESTPTYSSFIMDARVEREDYNFRFGPVLIDVIGTFGLEYDDNINTSENNPVEDFILQPGINFGLKWQINENNELDLNIGAEYNYYLSEDDLNEAKNQFGISPNTELSFRVLLGDIVLRVYDQIQYSFDSTDSVVIDTNTGAVTEADPDTFTRLSNVIGVQSEWFIGENAFSGQISREDVYSPDDEFSYVNKFVHKILLNWERALAANFTIGAGASYETFDFDDPVNNDGDVFSIGPFFDWKITEVIGLYAGGSVNDRSFDEGGLTDSAASSFGDTSDVTDFTWNIILSHVANDVFNHQIELYNAVNVSDTANFDEVDGVRYTIAYNITPRIRLDGAVGYEENESSGGLINDDFNRWLGGVSTELVLGPRLTADVGYEYQDKDSDAALQSYDRNRVRILVSYDF
ncbi:MAG: hypothetical protein AAGH40_01890 [Verrucomicrobiota bacterium]